MPVAHSRLRRIVRASPLGETHIAARNGDLLNSSRIPPPTAPIDAGDLVASADTGQAVLDHTTAPRAFDGAMYKYVTVAVADSPRLVQVGLAIPNNSPVSPRFNGTR